MKKKLIITAVIIIGFLIAGPLFIIEEGQQAVVVQFGEIIRDVTEAGIYLKVPFINEVHRFPKRILAWDGEANLMPTREKQYIFVDVTARWRINDPHNFYVSIGTLNTAYSKLAEIIDSEVRTVVAENYMRESVRNTNKILDRDASADDFGLGDEIDITLPIIAESSFESIEKGRLQLAEKILLGSQQVVRESQFGIELIDVVIRQIRYSDELTSSVYARMIKERNQIAQAIRSEGEGRRAEWLGRMDNEKRSILSAAYERAETIRGTADAEAARIYATTYNRDIVTRGFFDYWRAIESYRQTLPKFNKTLTTDMEYFRYLYTPR